MGICLSCLRNDDEDGQYDEQTSLLRNQQLYSSEYLQEEQHLKQQHRQQELKNIVNELSDKLIDVSTFLNNNSIPNTPNLTYSISSNATDVDKQFANVLSEQDKINILQESQSLDPQIKAKCEVVLKEPLFLEF